MFFASGNPSSARLHAFGKSWDLAIVDAPTGIRYRSEDISLWVKGDTAEVQRKDTIVFRDCVTAYAGIGNERSTDSLRSSVVQSHQPGVIRGSANWFERVSLRPTTVLIVTLEEVLLEGTSPILIAERSYPVRHQPRHPKRQVPIAFELEYSLDFIQPSSIYQISARLEDEGRILFATEAPSPVISGYPNRADLLLVRQARNGKTHEYPEQHVSLSH